ncbi:MAG: RNA 2',3'-cyclic phosphodiesterase [Gammaproteobacteria bacterium]|nr:MAG: RNA 2',3'-cyclic phosphodiesterase [Gammaproteobacteria bacterium]
MNERPATQRLFFALLPDATLHERLIKLCSDLAINGAPVAPGNLHLTLVFLGATDAATRLDIERACGNVCAAAFTLTLDQIGYWPKPRIVWLGSTATPPELSALVAGLNAIAARSGFSVDTRPYAPHITLARKARALKGRPVAPLQWEARGFSLMESQSTPQGVRYIELRRWELTPPAQPDHCPTPTTRRDSP